MAESNDGLPFVTPAEWGEWLSRNHASAPEVWICYWKKATGQPSIVWQQAVVEALCWGWIDGIAKSIDDKRYKQRFTPRRKGSIWSKINCTHVERLIAEGRMQAPGMRAVEMAKANGQWEKAYGGGAASIDVPAELQAALATNLLAQQLWNQLDARNRFAACFRVMSPKREATRLRKADEMVAMLVRGARIYP